mmetsp:Transcript_27070/g.90976  ORF Transcript_27070/g.90976 Transcript_27070/m.90976 type:complete len:369 (-) Transcript_27070:64-1170(-)
MICRPRFPASKASRRRIAALRLFSFSKRPRATKPRRNACRIDADCLRRCRSALCRDISVEAARRRAAFLCRASFCRRIANLARATGPRQSLACSCRAAKCRSRFTMALRLVRRSASRCLPASRRAASRARRAFSRPTPPRHRRCSVCAAVARTHRFACSRAFALARFRLVRCARRLASQPRTAAWNLTAPRLRCRRCASTVRPCSDSDVDRNDAASTSSSNNGFTFFFFFWTAFPVAVDAGASAKTGPEAWYRIQGSTRWWWRNHSVGGTSWNHRRRVWPYCGASDAFEYGAATRGCWDAPRAGVALAAGAQVPRPDSWRGCGSSWRGGAGPGSRRRAASRMFASVFAVCEARSAAKKASARAPRSRP